MAKSTFASVHEAIKQGSIRACHDLSEGGLAVAAAEMAFAGGLGISIDLSALPRDAEVECDNVLLFSESNTRFLVEVPGDKVNQFVRAMGDLKHARTGAIDDRGKLSVSGGDADFDATINELKAAWQSPLSDFA